MKVSIIDTVSKIGRYEENLGATLVDQTISYLRKEPDLVSEFADPTGALEEPQ